MTELDLLRVWTAGTERLLWQKARAQAKAGGDADRLAMAQHELETLPAPLVALAANRDLVQRLTGSRWYVVMLAREGSATWAQIADALGGTPKEAADAYAAAIARQEQYVGAPLHDAARARAVLAPAPEAEAGR